MWVQRKGDGVGKGDDGRVPVGRGVPPQDPDAVVAAPIQPVDRVVGERIDFAASIVHELLEIGVGSFDDQVNPKPSVVLLVVCGPAHGVAGRQVYGGIRRLKFHVALECVATVKDNLAHLKREVRDAVRAPECLESLLGSIEGAGEVERPCRWVRRSQPEVGSYPLWSFLWLCSFL